MCRLRKDLETGETSTDEATSQTEAAAEPSPKSASQDRNGQPPSPLDMLLREAEVIAQNLKESGTRR